MTMRRLRRTAAIGLLLASLVLAGVSTAQATAEEPIARGMIGSVNAVVNGQPVRIAPIARCRTDGGVAQASSAGATVRGFVEFDGGTTSCSFDATGETATALVTGKRFRMDGLRRYGGPLIRMTGFTATCSNTEDGSRARITYRGLTGLSLPAELPPNHVVTIRGTNPAWPVATVTLNQSIVPDPADGSMTVNAMQIRLFPRGGPAGTPRGTITVGSVHCSPF